MVSILLVVVSFFSDLAIADLSLVQFSIYFERSVAALSNCSAILGFLLGEEAAFDGAEFEYGDVSIQNGFGGLGEVTILRKGIACLVAEQTVDAAKKRQSPETVITPRRIRRFLMEIFIEQTE